MKRTDKPQNTALGDFIDTLKLLIPIAGMVLLFLLMSYLTGCVSVKKYNTLKKENERLKSELNDTKTYYKTLLLEAQRNDKTLWK